MTSRRDANANPLRRLAECITSPIRLVWFFIAVALIPGVGALAQTPTKEYIRLGGRVIAIESPASQQITVTISSPSTTVSSQDTMQFSAAVTGTINTAVTWTVVSGGGSINTSGLYTAPSVTANTAVTVKASSQADPSVSSTSSFTVVPVGAVTVSITPSTKILDSGASFQFTAAVAGASNTAVTWSIDGTGSNRGTIGSTSGTYTAPALTAAATVTIRATSVANPATSSTSTVTINPIVVAVSPSVLSVASGQTQHFTAQVTGAANTAVTWSVSPTGTIAINTGDFTAPTDLNAPNMTVTAASVLNPAAVGTAQVAMNKCVIAINVSGPATVYAGHSAVYGAAVTPTNCSSTPVLTWSLGSPVGTMSVRIFNDVYYTAPVDYSGDVVINAIATSGTTVVTVPKVIHISKGTGPSIVSVSPSSGSGSRQKFTTTVSDPEGNDDIYDLQLALYSDWGYACHVYYNATTNQATLDADDGSPRTGTVGASTTVSNSRCTLYLASSTVARSGTQLSLGLDFSFTNIFTGVKYIVVAGSDFARNVTPWTDAGSWLVPGVYGTSKSSLVSFSGPAQVAPGAQFQATVTMKNTGQDIWQSATLNPTQPYSLGATNPQDNLLWGPGRVWPAEQQVLPGQNGTFTINATAPQSAGARSFDWKMVHDAVEWFGATAPYTVTVTGSPYPESAHPYANNVNNQEWTYSYGGSCVSLNVTFDGRSALGSGDYINVRNGSGSLIPGSPFSGSSLGSTTLLVPGSTVKIALTSDGASTAWGFLVTNITCNTGGDPPGEYDDFYSGISYSGSWWQDTQFPDTRNHTVTYSNSANAAAQFTFVGSSITYYYTAAYNRGKASIYMDGVFVGKMDLYSPSVRWQQSSTFPVTLGTHTIRIVVAHEKSSAATDYYVDLDGFTVY